LMVMVLMMLVLILILMLMVIEKMWFWICDLEEKECMIQPARLLSWLALLKLFYHFEDK
jgi:hypothetical protein